MYILKYWNIIGEIRKEGTLEELKADIQRLNNCDITFTLDKEIEINEENMDQLFENEKGYDEMYDDIYKEVR